MKKALSFLGSLMAICFFALCTPIMAAPATDVSPEAVIEYTVKDGDTFSALGRQFCFDYQVVAREHGIMDPNRIYADKTVLRLKNGCTQAPQVLAKQKTVSPRELVSNGEASSGKRFPKLASRDNEAPQAPITAPAVSPAASAPLASAPQSVQIAVPAPLTEAPEALSKVYHRQIYRKAALISIHAKARSKAQNVELANLTTLIRHQVLARYQLPNPNCLYAEARTLGRNWEEQTLARGRCIRENYGTVIDEVAVAHKLSPAYIEAVIIAESGGQPDAISPTGCTGVKQFCLRSSGLFGLSDRFDPFESIRAGGRHLGDNLRMWRGNLAKATAHFNVGSVAVGNASFNAAEFPYTQSVLRVTRLLERGRSGHSPS